MPRPLVASLLPLVAYLMGGTVPNRSDEAPITIARTERIVPHRVFISGHSLTDRPYPDHLAALASARGRPIHWDMQNLHGSNLRDRIRGAASTGVAGVARNGEPVAPAREFRFSDEDRYDTLILAEQHTLLGNLIWNDTIGHAADFHERLIAASPSGRTYLFASWLDVAPRGDPTRWIAYEKAAAPVWSCVAARIDRRLAERGRLGGIGVIPAAAALAALVEQGSRPGGVSGLGARGVKGIMDTLFADDVHLTEAGTFYVALVTHHVLNDGPFMSDWSPPGVAPDTAAALRRFAARFVAWHRRSSRVLGPEHCRDHAARVFAPLYLAYQRDGRWRREGAVRAYLKWARYRLRWPLLLRGTSPANPLA